MQYCININQIKSNQIKSNQIKSGIICFKQYFLKIFLTALLSFIALFSISCNNAYEPFDDIPTISGEPATRRFEFYKGDFKRVKLEVSPETAKNRADAEVIFSATYSGQILSKEGKYSVDAPHSTIKNATLYEYGNKSYYGVSQYYNARIDNGNVKSYMKFTYTIDGNIINVTDYIVVMTMNGMSIRATYTAILSYSGPIE